MKFVVGIDEAGRGPLAGPVAVGVAVVPVAFDWTLLPGLTDSKKLSEKERVRLYDTARELRYHRQLNFTVAQVGAGSIDARGIQSAVRQAMIRAIRRLGLDTKAVHIVLDGGLMAPPEYSQETIIKGDVSEPAISLASVVAKVTRDKYMYRISRRYVRYNFAEHKGYGTKAHREVIQQCGLTPIHRATYCKNIRAL